MGHTMCSLLETLYASMTTYGRYKYLSYFSVQSEDADWNREQELQVHNTTA